MKVLPIMISAAVAVFSSAETVRSFTPEELVPVALSDNPELLFYEQQVSALPKPSSDEVADHFSAARLSIARKLSPRSS